MKGTDKNGAKVELYVDPATGEVVKPAPRAGEKS
ncbi:PepSY domain-containing protein [Vibrio parahaemolyticus]